MQSMPKRPKRAVSEVFRKDMSFRLDNPYRNPQKYPSDTECPGCGLLFQDGVWKMGLVKPERELHRHLCPACLQIRDDYPGGVLSLQGSFFDRHRDDIVHRIRNVEKTVREQHPLQRIMRIEEKSGELVVYTTDQHLAARLGKALRRDFGGELDLTYAKEDKFASARWRRDD
jgi:hypothetical protein